MLAVMDYLFGAKVSHIWKPTVYAPVPRVLKTRV